MLWRVVDSLGKLGRVDHRNGAKVGLELMGKDSGRAATAMLALQRNVAVRLLAWHSSGLTIKGQG